MGAIIDSLKPPHYVPHVARGLRVGQACSGGSSESHSSVMASIDYKMTSQTWKQFHMSQKTPI